MAECTGTHRRHQYEHVPSDVLETMIVHAETKKAEWELSAVDWRQKLESADRRVADHDPDMAGIRSELELRAAEPARA
ncbi:hypothetical protein ACFQ36_01145 [Arthrobacter sp. GCM10027362]|uniref:hypothetical protein n=1 Tax=Arthrobacter sp. GCM10027362 TaxID=3273379 RepID=UPI00362F4064